MQALGDVMVGNIERRFETKRDPSGRKWEELRPATVEWYRMLDTDPKTGKWTPRGSLLERTRRMRDSLSANASDDAVTVGMNRLTKGGRWSIPLLHETGTRRMVARSLFLGNWSTGTLGAEDERDLEDEIAAFLDDLFGPG